jgi:hypothetical protein
LRRKRSEGRLRTPPGWRRLDRPSRLWKTLKSVALQGNAQDHENTGVSAIGGGVRGEGKGHQVSGGLGSPVQTKTRTLRRGRELPGLLRNLGLGREATEAGL